MDFVRLILLAFALLPTYVFAQVDFYFYDSPVLEKMKDGNWKSSVGVEVRPSNLPSKRLKTSVTLSSLSAGKMVLKAISRATPYAVALSVAMEAFGYFYDKNQNSFSKVEGSIAKDGYQEISNSCGIEGETGCYYASNKHWCGVTKIFAPNSDVSGLVLNNCTSMKPVNGRFPIKVLIGKPYNSIPDSFDLISDNPISNNEIGDLILDNNAPLFQKVLNDSIKTGSYEQDWPELKSRIDEIKNSFDSAENALDPVNGINPDVAAVEDSSDKSFCDWAPKLCALADFFMDPVELPQNPDLPVKEVSPVKWESGLPSGSCPTLPPVVFQGQSMTYDLSNACWAASSVFKPILISLSLIGAAFILAGVKL